MAPPGFRALKRIDPKDSRAPDKMLTGFAFQKFFDDLSAHLQNGAFESVVLCFKLPATLRFGTAHMQVNTYSMLIEHFRSCRVRLTDLTEMINVFHVKPNGKRRWIVDLEWVFTNSDGTEVQRSLQKVHVISTKRGSLKITQMHVIEVWPETQIAQLPLIA